MKLFTKFYLRDNRMNGMTCERDPEDISEKSD